MEQKNGQSKQDLEETKLHNTRANGLMDGLI